MAFGFSNKQLLVLVVLIGATLFAAHMFAPKYFGLAPRA